MGQYSYRDQIAVIENIRLKDGQTHRGNCPFCGGRNTFSITRHGNLREWNCYRASCDCKGRVGEGDSPEGIQRKLDGNSVELTFPEIPVLSPIDNQPAALKWLDMVHCLGAYRENLIDIRFAPAEDRICFAVQNGLGWTGRARKGVKPKWRKYGDTTGILSVGRGSTAIVVEDACSACAVGVIPEYTGCALLGTNLTHTHIMQLRQFENVLVCLDPDAMGKALDMVNRIQGTVPSSMRLIPDDLKNYDPEEIRKILNAE